MMKAIIYSAVAVLLSSAIIASGQVLTQSDVTTGDGVLTGSVVTGPGGPTTGGEIILSGNPFDPNENPPADSQEPWQTVVPPQQPLSEGSPSIPSSWLLIVPLLIPGV